MQDPSQRHLCCTTQYVEWNSDFKQCLCLLDPAENQLSCR